LKAQDLLPVRRFCGVHVPYFELLGFRVIDEHRGALMPRSEATVKVRVGAREEHMSASGNGPVNALDKALRRALERFYPALSEMHLVDYKVRVITSQLRGTASRARVDYFERWSWAVGHGGPLRQHCRSKLARSG
jgi:2-isopropylmalate synthase